MVIEILFVKNMVCHRCILAVEEVLRKSGIPFQQVITGEIHLDEKINSEETDRLTDKLVKIGLELIDNRVSGTVEKIKQFVIRKARNELDEKENKMKLSAYLAQKLYHEYTYLSSLFSSVEGRTIESYFIEQRIEKVKELLVYKEMTLSQISFEMEYSSVAHLSNQFKKVTGHNSSYFIKAGSDKRKLLDHV
jgi:AraC family transcriptional regulator